MANYHVLTINDRKDRAQVVFHIAVPDENNFVNVSLRLALKQYLESAFEDSIIKSAVPWITTELTDLQDCSIYEHSETVQYNANETDANKRSAIDDRWTQLGNKIPNILRERFRFWGLDRNV